MLDYLRLYQAEKYDVVGLMPALRGSEKRGKLRKTDHKPKSILRKDMPHSNITPKNKTSVDFVERPGSRLFGNN